MYLRQDFEWAYTWYVVVKLKSSAFSFLFCAKAFTIELINCLYSSILSTANIAASRANKNKLIWGLLRT